MIRGREEEERESARGDAAPMHLKLSPFARSLVCVYVDFLGRRYPAENASSTPMFGFWKKALTVSKSVCMWWRFCCSKVSEFLKGEINTFLNKPQFLFFACQC
jgi:hypothetical protein